MTDNQHTAIITDIIGVYFEDTLLLYDAKKDFPKLHFLGVEYQVVAGLRKIGPLEQSSGHLNTNP